jgi:hypothetical protein
LVRWRNTNAEFHISRAALARSKAPDLVLFPNETDSQK